MCGTAFVVTLGRLATTHKGAGTKDGHDITYCMVGPHQIIPGMTISWFVVAMHPCLAMLGMTNTRTRRAFRCAT
jgi:hypothetical protein